MQKYFYTLIASILILSASVLSAQTDMTSLIANPSFEENADDLATGWTYEGGCDTYTWHVVNTDGDATKDGDNICGLWNPEFGDVAITQTLSGLDNGTYKVTALLSVGVNGATATERLTTQRIFANNNSVMYSEEANYSTENLAVLTDTLGETLTFAGHAVSSAENGPFQLCEVTTEVTDGTLYFGIKTNGTQSTSGFNFPDAGTDGWGWFKMDNFTLTLMGNTAVNDVVVNPMEVSVNNGFITVEGVKEFQIINLNGAEISPENQLAPGLYVVRAGNQTKKVAVSY